MNQHEQIDGFHLKILKPFTLESGCNPQLSPGKSVKVRGDISPTWRGEGGMLGGGH